MTIFVFLNLFQSWKHDLSKANGTLIVLERMLLLKDVIRLTLVNFHKADKFPSEHEWTVISQLVHCSASAVHDAVFSVASSGRSKTQPTFCRGRITQQCLLPQERSTSCSKRWNKKLMPNSWLVVLFLADSDVSAGARGVTWNRLPQEIQLVRNCLLRQLKQRFAPNGSGESSSLIWTRAALCHPKGKMLNWLSQQSRDAAIADFRALVLQYSLVADPAPAMRRLLPSVSLPGWNGMIRYQFVAPSLVLILYRANLETTLIPWRQN